MWTKASPSMCFSGVANGRNMRLSDRPRGSFSRIDLSTRTPEPREVWGFCVVFQVIQNKFFLSTVMLHFCECLLTFLRLMTKLDRIKTIEGIGGNMRAFKIHKMA
jgi:hypothetical protein